MPQDGSIESANEQQGFIERLHKIAAKLGSKASLARRAGVPISSLDAYFNGAEPTRPVLKRLAEASKVSLDWLAGGRGREDGDATPEGYVPLIYFDLRMTGPHIRAINFASKERRLIRQADLYEARTGAASFVVGGAEEGLKFSPVIHTGDTFLVSVSLGHSIEHPTMASAWPIEDGPIYFVAEGAELKLRKLHRAKDGSVSVVTEDGKVESKLTGAPRNFILYGPTIWRAGIILRQTSEKPT
jgi:hypothetical protein